jgi:hypothetical protein
VWHVVIFPKYYKKLAIYSRIEKPRFVFGVLAMLTQSIVFAYLFDLVPNQNIFWLGMFLLLESFMVFAELGKQNTSSVVGFLCIQTVFSAIQVGLVALGYYVLF